MKSIASIQDRRLPLADKNSRNSRKIPVRLISVGIIEREQISFEGLAAILDRMIGIERTDSCRADESICAYVDRVQPNVLILSHDGELTVLELEEVCRCLPKMRVLLLLPSRIRFDMSIALRSGLMGIVSKRASIDELSRAIRALSSGEPYLSHEFSPRLVEGLSDSHLTSREFSVLNELAVGHSSKIIARTLNISEGTVKSHIKKIFEKLDANSRSHAVFQAVQRGLLPFLAGRSLGKQSSVETFGDNQIPHF